MPLRPCPHCGADHGVRRIRVAFAGHFNPAICKRCGGKFLTEFWQVWLIGEIALLPASYVSFASTSSLLFLVALGIGILIALTMQMFFASLVRY